MLDSHADSARYLLKVLVGLAVFAALVGSALISTQIPLNPSQRSSWLLLTTMPLLGIYPLMRWRHGRSDEMLQRLHHQACLFSVGISASVLAVAGILQAAGLLPTLNALFGLACLIASWALGLMLADRSMH